MIRNMVEEMIHTLVVLSRVKLIRRFVAKFGLFILAGLALNLVKDEGVAYLLLMVIGVIVLVKTGTDTKRTREAWNREVVYR